MSWEMPIMARLLTTGGILGSVLARLLLISQWDHHAARLSKLRQSTAANAGHSEAKWPHRRVDLWLTRMRCLAERSIDFPKMRN